MSLMIPAGDLQLEALLKEPQDVIKGGVVVCHPHPLYGEIPEIDREPREEGAADDPEY